MQSTSVSTPRTGTPPTIGHGDSSGSASLASGSNRPHEHVAANTFDDVDVEPPPKQKPRPASFKTQLPFQRPKSMPVSKMLPSKSPPCSAEECRAALNSVHDVRHYCHRCDRVLCNQCIRLHPLHPMTSCAALYLPQQAQHRLGLVFPSAFDEDAPSSPPTEENNPQDADDMDDFPSLAFFSLMQKDATTSTPTESVSGSQRMQQHDEASERSVHASLRQVPEGFQVPDDAVLASLRNTEASASTDRTEAASTQSSCTEPPKSKPRTIRTVPAALAECTPPHRCNVSFNDPTEWVHVCDTCSMLMCPDCTSNHVMHCPTHRLRMAAVGSAFTRAGLDGQPDIDNTPMPTRMPSQQGNSFV